MSFTPLPRQCGIGNTITHVLMLIVQASGCAPRLQPPEVGAKIPLGAPCHQTTQPSHTNPGNPASPSEGQQLDVRASKASSEAAPARGSKSTFRLDQDPTAHDHAIQHRADFLVAASALTTLLTLSADSGGSWQIPVHVSTASQVSPAQIFQIGGEAALQISPDLPQSDTL